MSNVTGLRSKSSSTSANHHFYQYSTPVASAIDVPIYNDSVTEYVKWGCMCYHRDTLNNITVGEMHKHRNNLQHQPTKNAGVVVLKIGVSYEITVQIIFSLWTTDSAALNRSDQHYHNHQSLI